MNPLRHRLGRIALSLALSTTLPAIGADLVDGIDEAYAVRQLRRTPFDARAARNLAPGEARFLQDLFDLSDEAVLLDTNVRRWFESEGDVGLHAADYLERLDALRRRLDALETPERLESIHRLLAESLALQRAFVADWQRALDAGRPFESQLTDEFAYHEGLHRSQRLLRKVYAELRALFPQIGDATHRAFHDHLRALSLQ